MALLLLSHLAVAAAVTLSPSFSILTDNPLIPAQVKASPTYLLLRDGYNASQRVSACGSLGESVITSNESSAVGPLLAQYNHHNPTHQIHTVWIDDSCIAFSMKHNHTISLDCALSLPVLCTNTAPYESGAETPSTDAHVFIDTPQGAVMGFRDRLAVRFQGLAYAKPPLGELRFQAPQSVERLTNGTVYDATYFRPVCPQDLSNNPGIHNKEPTSEDCLYLNVYTPSMPAGQLVDGLPVIFWIHGGSYYYGGSSFPYYHGMNLASRESAVVVTIQYRLGILGFLSDPERFDTDDAATNQAMRDQLLALQWTNDYIHYYGGDPDRIMVIGESAGGTSVMSMLQTPAAEGLFSRAVVESGNTLSGWQRPDVNHDLVSLFLNISGCDDLPCLRNCTAEDLLSAQDETFRQAQAIFPRGKVNFIEPLRPFIDDDLITEDWDTALLNGRFNKVPTLITYNHDEFGLFLQENNTFKHTPVDYPNATLFLSSFMLGPNRTNIILNDPSLPYNKSLVNSTNIDTPIVKFLTDFTYRCNAQIYAQYLASHNPATYELTWEMGVAQFMNGSLCSAPDHRICHGMEVVLFLGSEQYDGLPVSTLNESITGLMRPARWICTAGLRDRARCSSTEVRIRLEEQSIMSFIGVSRRVCSREA